MNLRFWDSIDIGRQAEIDKWQADPSYGIPQYCPSCLQERIYPVGLWCIPCKEWTVGEGLEVRDG